MRSLMLVSAALALAVSSASAESILLPLGYASPPYQTERPFRTIQIGDSKVLDVRAATDQTVTLQPLAKGSTNVLFFDEGGKLIDHLDVTVTTTAPGTLQIWKPGEPGHGMASMLYRCADRQGCEYVGAGQIPVGVPPSAPTVYAPSYAAPSYGPAGPVQFQVR